MFGLPEHILKMLKEYFLSHKEITKVIIYGSRAMQREKPGSDIDLAILCSEEKDISRKVQNDLEELPTPYIFDVVDYNHLTHQPLIEHIDRVGIILFQRDLN